MRREEQLQEGVRMNVVLDIAAALSAVVWPVIVLIVLLAYRSHVPAVFGGLANRINKLAFAGFSVELAQATPFIPNWRPASTVTDLRRQATSVQLSDSYRSTSIALLNDANSGDFAEINLGRGEEWLTSRLFIMTILFARMKGLRCFVFVETTDSVRKKFVGWAEPDKIRWALARRFPWLEAAYAKAYDDQMARPGTIIASHEGRLAYAGAPNDALAGIDLLGNFLGNVQSEMPVQHSADPSPSIPPPSDLIGIGENTQEHASWLGADELEAILGNDLKKDSVNSNELKRADGAAQMKAILSVPGPYVPVVASDGRFEYLLRGEIIVEQVTKMLTSDAAARS